MLQLIVLNYTAMLKSQWLNMKGKNNCIFIYIDTSDAGFQS